MFSTEPLPSIPLGANKGELKMKAVNKIVIFLLALSVFPITIFLELVRGVFSISQSSSLYTILSRFAESMVNSSLELTYSVKEIIEKIGEGGISFAGMSFDMSKIPAELLEGKGWIIAAVVLFVVALVIAVVIMGCILFTKAYKTISCLGAGGAICTFAAMRCFAQFAVPYLDGTHDIGELLSEALIGDDANLLGTIGSAFLKNAISVESLSLGNAVTLTFIVFLGIALWELAYFITIPEEKPKKIKNK